MDLQVLILWLGAFLLVVNALWMLFCGKKLGVRYAGSFLPSPLVLAWGTALMGAMVLYVGSWLTPSGGTMSTPILGFGLVTSGVATVTLGWVSLLVDVRIKVLPTQLTALMAVEVFGCWVVFGAFAGFTYEFLFAPFLGATIWVVPIAIGFLTGNVGMGDVRLSTVLGFALGTSSLILSVFGLMVALVGAAVQGGIVVAKKGWGNKRFAMGPHLLVGMWGAWGVGAVGSIFTVALQCGRLGIC